MSKKVYVCCPGGAVSGGPELLHQFVDALRSYNVDAYILYVPFDKDFLVAKPYEHYVTPVARYQQISFSDSLVVLPEVLTGLVNAFDDAKKVIWWLSVDNYFDYSAERSFKEYIYHNLRVFLGRKASFKKLKPYTHLSQSEYARLYLEKKGLHSGMLTDYLNEAHLVQNNSVSKNNRENIIAYNPKKGVKFTEQLITNNPDIKFVPIQGMTPIQVKDLLSKSKVYIDFGNHPGKDRFPREAVMAGCCIITGIKGSAANDIDIPISRKYKINESSKDFNATFRQTINEIFSNFEYCSAEFEKYRYQVKSEPFVFREQVKEFVNNFLT